MSKPDNAVYGGVAEGSEVRGVAIKRKEELGADEEAARIKRARMSVGDMTVADRVGGATLSDSDSDDEEGAPPVMGSLDSMRNAFMKAEPSGPKAAPYNEVAKKLMEKMGFKEGSGLGRHGQGRVAPVESSQQKGRRGLGHSVAGFEASGTIEWNYESEVVSAEETVDWLPENTLSVPCLEELKTWSKEGKKKLTIEDEKSFCKEQTLLNILQSKSVFDNLEAEEMRKARTKSNPYETIRGCFFLNRAAMKMANMDAVLSFMFTNPTNKDGRSVLSPGELLYFADVCAGPGGFSEYVLWRKGCDAKGFGFTLRGANDFKLEDFYAASAELFEPHYGKGGSEGDGDIYNPENLTEFQNFVLSSTDGRGVHFVMADGGFCVDGEENIQEILSKRLYLCQALCALMVLRTGGHFVCKLFDIFTSFSVGLVYLMYRAFERVAIFKPVTSRPANSERYIVCRGMRADVAPIRDYLYALNTRMCDVWPGRSTSDLDVREVVPSDLITDDQPFFNYIVDSNEKLGYQQVVSLLKIQAFAKNSNLHEHRQTEMRKECLRIWQIPDEVRTAPDRSDNPQARFASLTKDAGSDYHSEPLELTPALLSDRVKSLYDYRCFVSAAEQRWILLSYGRSHMFRWDGRAGMRWSRVEDLKVELPKDTLLDVEFVTELRGEGAVCVVQGKGQRKMLAVHIIDALFICGADLRALHFNERMERARKLVRAIHRPTRSDLAPVRVRDPVRLEQIDSVFHSLQMKLVKGAGQTRRLCYCCSGEGEEPSRCIVPLGVYFTRIVRDPWMMAMSKSQNRKYFYNTKLHSAVYETPKDAIASYLQCAKSRMLWKWESSPNQNTALSSDSTPTVQSAALSQDALMQFVHDKLTAP